jgi:hypothetical protein
MYRSHSAYGDENAVEGVHRGVSPVPVL